ncbi:MAG: PDZ domain-containing protein [Planctomycetes bacterium]|nr:PDZ domain-containing protein [Planctomycetota bacterium]
MRVVNMKGVDLNAFEFDYDLTLAILMMNADGTVYHRYGGRDWTSAMSRQSMPSLVQALAEGAAAHGEYAKNPKPPAARPKKTIEDIPVFAERVKKNPKMDCFHCHMVYNAEREQAQAEKRWNPEEMWLYPLPEQAGLRLETDDQARVKEVVKGSPAEKAGVKAGDRLVRLGGVRAATEADVQWILQNADRGATSLKIEVERGGEAKSGDLKLAKGWKVQTPLEYSWRPYKWQLRPNPGFGGPDLKADEKKKLGLKEDAFAVKVGYIIDWGDHPEDGKNARKAGIQKDDVLISAGGKVDFKGSEHFQTWFRLTQKAGSAIEFVVIRGGKQIKIRMDVLP